MARIFINYRRGDTSSNASRLCEWLGERYGEDQVFMDVDAIEPGLDWARAIENAVGSADLVLAMIGKDWLAELKRRSADDDFMRYELETALSRDIRVIPVLVEGAKMPPTAELPESLASLTRRQAFEIRDERFRFDKEELFRRVDRALEGQGVAVPRAQPEPHPNGSARAPVSPVQPAEDDAPVENELKKWNWGAFLLGPVWGIGNGVWRSFLTLVPFYGFYEWVLLGLRGNRWAWEQRRYENAESFRKSQRKWAMWGAIVDSILFLIVLGSSGG
ncbi:MAG TPA: toll/interleukin-1 receptor domain-containing protein [Gaiellaceae bacterium]|nr:toll/interleukin-1 receptor domain-containing protein [Gaiellaceae bacterium]